MNIQQGRCSNRQYATALPAFEYDLERDLNAHFSTISVTIYIYIEHSNS